MTNLHQACGVSGCAAVQTDQLQRCRLIYVGHSLLLEEEHCRSTICRNGGTCSAGSNGDSCRCLPGFSGPSCESKSDRVPWNIVSVIICIFVSLKLLLEIYSMLKNIMFEISYHVSHNINLSPNRADEKF